MRDSDAEVDVLDRIFVSSNAIPAASIADIIDTAARRGIKHIELSSGIPWHPSIREDVLTAAAHGTRIVLHNYFPPPREPFVVNLASGDAEIRRRSIEHCRSSISLSAEIGAPFYSVHAGFSQDPEASDLGGQVKVRSSRTLADAEPIFFDSLALLSDVADAAGVHLLIENNVLSRRNLINGRNELLLGVTAADFARLFKAVPHPRLRMLLDVGHLNVSAETLGLDRDLEFERMRPYVLAVHVSDNDGTVDDNGPFDRRAWFLRHFAAIPGAWFVIETKAVPAATLSACITLVQDVI